MVLTNPPFGRKNSITIEQIERQGFWATTSNNQLNFLQHVKTLLAINGKAAIVVPDNVLFEGGAGETVRRKLLAECDVHTLLRLPTGIFYAHGVKANVLFFDRKPVSAMPWTKKLWIYDLRTDQHFTKQNPLRYEDLKDFIHCFNSENRHERTETERFKAFNYEELIQQDKASLDIEIMDDVDINPPTGFKAVPLGDIADLTIGLRIPIDRKGTENLASTQTCLVRIQNILPDGSLNLDDARRIDTQTLEEDVQEDSLNKHLLQPNDILLSTTRIRDSKKVAIVPDNLPGLVTFANSLVRVRVRSNLADAKDVFTFLKSDSGQISIQRLASNTVGISRISVQSLAKMLIFLPEKQAETKADVEELSVAARAVRQIKNYILPLLEEMEKSGIEKNSDGYDFEVEEIGIEKSLNDHKLEVVASKLHKLAFTLAPPPLSEIVMTHYPTPIALAYRRFHDAQFNVYEQVLRLKDIFESTSFFIYNLVLADVFRRLDPKQFYIDKNKGRRAYNHHSMHERMLFVDEVIKIATPTGGRDLFIPELVNSSVVSLAQKLQSWRNQLSHTATSTESKQRKALDDFRPIVEKLLTELKFLADYKLVRIPYFYCKQEQLICMMEVYAGVVPNLAKQPIGKDSQLTQAENDHLILLDMDGQILDLYPLYQIIDNEQTHYETHLCFFKRRRTEKKVLEGESIHNPSIYQNDDDDDSSSGIQLMGFEDFEELQKRIRNEKPGP
jgi:hypothetical protein